MNQGTSTTGTERPPAKIRVLVVDEQPLLRSGISTYLNSQPDMVVCGEADSISDAEKKIAECHPHVVVTELRVGTGDSLKLVKRLKAEHRTLGILVYSTFEENMFAERVMRAGASGYLMKRAPKEKLAAAVRDIVRSGIYVSREVALSAFSRSLQRRPKTNRSRDALEKLSDREMHIFQLVGSGMGTTEIAHLLQLSVKTIESHRENIKHKLQLATGTQLRERAVRWVERASGVRNSGNVRIYSFWKGKRSDPAEELQRRDQESAADCASHALSLDTSEAIVPLPRTKG
jgi:DNA-binding NarL/FixJ family response regulator